MFVIGVSGGSGSGKTSFIRDLKSRFKDSELAILSLDEYYKPQELQTVDKNGVVNFDLPTALDMESCLADIKKLKNGEVVRRKEYTFNNAEKEAEDIVINPAPIIVVEGLFIFHNVDIRSLLDFKIMVHASDIHKIIRRILRDQKERNYPLDDVLYRYQHHVKPSYDQYIRPYMEEVDLVINNNTDYCKALDMVAGYLRGHIS